MTCYVIKRSWRTVAHEGNRASCETWVANVTSLGFERRADLVIVEGAANLKLALKAVGLK